MVRSCNFDVVGNGCTQNSAFNITAKGCYCNSNYCNVGDVTSMNNSYVASGAPRTTAVPITTTVAALTKVCAVLFTALYMSGIL